MIVASPPLHRYRRPHAQQTPRRPPPDAAGACTASPLVDAAAASSRRALDLEVRVCEQLSHVGTLVAIGGERPAEESLRLCRDLAREVELLRLL